MKKSSFGTFVSVSIILAGLVGCSKSGAADAVSDKLTLFTNIIVTNYIIGGVEANNFVYKMADEKRFMLS